MEGGSKETAFRAKLPQLRKTDVRGVKPFTKGEQWEILPRWGCVPYLAAGALSARVGLSLGFFSALFGPGLVLAGIELTLFLCSHTRKSGGLERVRAVL